MNLSEAEAVVIRFGTQHPGKNLGAIVREDPTYIDFLLTQTWLDSDLRSALEIVGQEHKRAPKVATEKPAAKQLGLGI